MGKITVRKVWALAFLMAGFSAGCGREQAAGTPPTLTIPTVVSSNPLNDAIPVPINQKIIATFS
jgi:hypothetical protein